MAFECVLQFSETICILQLQVARFPSETYEILNFCLYILINGSYNELVLVPVVMLTLAVLIWLLTQLKGTLVKQT